MATPIIEPPIVTDRPATTESSLTVLPGRFQLEIGLNAFDVGEGVAMTTPTKARVGIVPDLELYVESDVLVIIFRPTNNAYDIADIDLGAKIHLFDGEGLLPSLAIIPHVTLPTGAFFGPHALGVTTRAAMEWGLTESWTFATTLGLLLPLTNRHLVSTTLLAATSLFFNPSAAPHLRLFAEAFSEIPFDADDRHPLYAGGGLAYRILPTFQVDLYGRAPIYDAHNYIVGAGASVRY